ncbi:MAG: hypothetical protein LLG04_06730 [Parachlamydia sp.]|nr:hypothetical protein [Parachlamydia sp.]
MNGRIENGCEWSDGNWKKEKGDMATKQEIKAHLKIALEEIGEIKPWFDRDVNAWIFEHKLYPVGCSGDSSAEVVKKFPRYLKEFITERLKNNLNPRVEKRTVGKGGKREGAGRPKDPNKEEKVRVYLPHDIAKWIKYPETIMHIRSLMRAYPR